MTIIVTNFHKKGCWILKYTNRTSRAMQISRIKKKTSKEEKFDAKMSIRIDKHIFGLEEEETIPCK